MAGSFIRFNSNRQHVISALEAAAHTRMEQACIHLTNEVKKTLTGQRHGRRYKVPGTTASIRINGRWKRRGRWYTASAPGEAPAVLTGQLRNSIKYRIQGRGLKIQGIVGSPLEKAPWLEFGTSKMAARPFLKNTYNHESSNIKRILGGTWLL